MELTLERRTQTNETPNIVMPSGGLVSMTPPIDEDYWEFRVRLTDTQAIVGFPKFNTIGIGFAVEEDWNTNLPYRCDAEDILDHIWHNAGEESITREDVLEAIRMVQRAAYETYGGKPLSKIPREEE